LRIGIDVRKIKDYGIGTHIRNVVLSAASIAKHHEFFLYYDPSDPPDLSRNSKYHWVAEPSGKYSIREHFSLASKVKRNGVELFHSPHYTLPLFLNCPAVVTVHDLIHFKFSEYFPMWKVQAAKYVLRSAAKKARRIITVSRTTQNDLIEWLPESKHKITVIYNRLSEEWFQSSASIEPEMLGIRKDFILYVGNFKKHKGIDTLLEAYKLGRDLPQLVLIGQGHHADHDLTVRILNTPNIRLLGFAEPRILRSLYSRASLFVFPSLYEGFGYPPLEAMAAGCPVLSSDAPAMKEILADAAIFFQRGNVEDLYSKLQTVLSDNELRKNLVQTGIAHAKKFVSDESPRKLLEQWS
jgi:glycosyltransferase involved in cell wall biosynthesis